jgi:LmbE family N-acetylglucosaminyl deacetylase
MSTVLVIHAHPDDEVYATGGRISALAAAGHRVITVIATGGEASEMTGASHLSLQAARDARVRKYAKSVTLLGAARWEWLDEPGRWIDGDPNLFSIVGNEEPGVLAEVVGDCIDRHNPELILTAGADGLTGHPDHVAIAAAVRRAVRRRGTPTGGVWGARLRAIDVVSAHNLLAEVLGSMPVGSGRVTGTSDELCAFDVAASAKLRGEALDIYSAGLGSTLIGELVTRYTGRGDSLLMRDLLDATTWSTEYYEDLTITTARHHRPD